MPHNCIAVYSCLLGTHNSDSFDVVLSGVDASTLVHTSDSLEEFARVLKPSGKVILREPTVKEGLWPLMEHSGCLKQSVRFQLALMYWYDVLQSFLYNFCQCLIN